MKALPILGAAILCLSPQVGQSEPMTIDPPAVFTCLSAMDETTTWGQCLGLTFASCADLQVGSREHGACLIDLRNLWRADAETRRVAVMGSISPEGQQALSALLEAWPKYIDDKCKAVGAMRADSGEASALLGCEVSEHVLLASEFEACLEGRSPEDYCQRID